eukprot:Nitzschia sp. Nitz4//scaffold77_size91520//88634//90145//NITZ4_004909-RA/size91520-processed-gene-0.43-mRNA-1//1//CDS//3329558050//2802//frame0
MDFSRSQQGLNNVSNGNSNDQSASFEDLANNTMMMGSMDQNMLMRRMAANRAAGLQGMGQDNSSITLSGPNPMMGGGSSMFGQTLGGTNSNTRGANTNANQNSIVGQMGGSADARLAMIQQQADRDELLFQLLLARHRRQAELQQDITNLQQQQQDLGGNQQGFGLRNQGGNGGGSNGSSSFFPDQDQSSQNQQQGMLPGVFSGGMNLMGPGHPAFNPTMLQDPTNRTTNSLLFGMQQQQQQQQQQAQDPFLAGLSKDSQRIDPSTSNRFLSLQQQPGAGGMGGIGGMMDFGNNSSNKRGFGDDMKPAVAGDMDKLMGFMGGEPPSKKKRFHKKKPADMPRRPLSAYNLFFSEERERILKEIDQKEDGANASSSKNDSSETSADDNIKTEIVGDGATEESKKPRALLQPLLPSEKKRRPHRKTHGKIGFRMLAQMVGKRWKELPEEKRAYYQELAKEDTRRQKKAMEEYYLKHSDKLPQDATGDEPQGSGAGVKQEGVDSSQS